MINTLLNSDYKEIRVVTCKQNITEDNIMADIKKKIVRELKNMGYSNRKIGVSSHYFITGSYFNVTIKDANIDKHEIELALEKYESIDRDVATCEIMQGPENVFVLVDYDYRLDR